MQAVLVVQLTQSRRSAHVLRERGHVSRVVDAASWKGEGVGRKWSEARRGETVVKRAKEGKITISYPVADEEKPPSELTRTESSLPRSRANGKKAPS